MRAFNTGPISLLQPGDAVKATDEYAATDTTDLTQSPSGSMKKYTVNQLIEFAINNFSASNISSAQLGTTVNLDADYVNGVAGLDDGIGATLTNNGVLGALAVDGVVVSLNDRILVAFQTDPIENGVYSVTVVGDSGTPWVLTRVTDYDGSALGQINQGDFIAVLFGNINSLSWWFLTSDSQPVIGTDPIVFDKQVNVVAEPWQNQTTTPEAMNVNTGYTASAGATQVDFVLPVTAAVGSYVEITGNDIGGYLISQAAGQQIQFGTTSTTVGVGGSITADDQYGNIRLRCIVANTLWTVAAFVGTFTIV